MQMTGHSLIERFDVRLHRVADGPIRGASSMSSWEHKDGCLPEEAVRPPIEAHVVGLADNRFYAQKGSDKTLYILPRAAFVTMGLAILADLRGEAAVWIPCPQDAPEYLSGACTVTILGFTGGEEDRHCERETCASCRNHECLAYVGPQGRGTPSWHTLSPRGTVASAWTLAGEVRHQ